jgi:hypothetical protein
MELNEALGVVHTVSRQQSMEMTSVMRSVFEKLTDEQRPDFMASLPAAISELSTEALIGDVYKAEIKQFDILSRLTPEQREQADQLKIAMAAKFNVSEDDFSVQESWDGNQTHLVVAYNDGVKAGSWDDIFGEDNAEKFIVTIDGKEYDTRTGMTSDLQAALIQSGIIKSGHLNLETWLTGEQLVRSRAPISLPHREDISWVDRRRDTPWIRFRPSVVIE